MKANQFYMDSWQAWLPGIDEHEGDWQGFFQGRWQASEAKADVSFLPAMQRRRLSPLARAVAYVLHHNASTQGAMVFCTRYGEVERTDGILRDIATEQEVSPTAFGLSVFNAIAGQISILQNNTEATSTLVPPEDGYLVAFADGLGRLQQENLAAITLVFYEEPLSEVLAPYCYPLPCIMALAVTISNKPQADASKAWRLTYEREQASQVEPGAGMVELMRFFTLQEHQIQLGHWKISGE